MAAPDQFVDELGVKAVNTSQIEETLLHKAQRATQPEPGVSEVDAQTQKVKKRLRAIRREIQAVEDGLNSVQAEAGAEDAKEEPLDRPLQQSGLRQGDLQRATMLERLSALQAKETHLQAALDNTETTEPSSSEAAQPNQGGNEASTSDSKAGPRKVKQKKKAPLVPAAQLLEDEGLNAELDAANAGGLVETERDRLIRTGVLTPFDRLDGFERRVQSGAAASAGQAGPSSSQAAVGQQQQQPDPFKHIADEYRQIRAGKTHAKLMDPAELPRRQQGVRRVDEGFWRQSTSSYAAPAAAKSKRKQTLERAPRKAVRIAKPGRKRRRITKRKSDDDSESEFSLSDEAAGEGAGVGGSDQGPSDSASFETDSELSDDPLGEYDDADEDLYEQRRHKYARGYDNQDMEEDVVFDGGYQVPGGIYSRLFDYQKTGVKWLWELHTQRAGGIIGDEMGLGKTIQLAAFLAGLQRSGMFKPSIIVCPATVMRQWLRELRAWYPPFRVVIMHDSAKNPNQLRPQKKELIRSIADSSAGILVTSYDQLRLQRDLLLNVAWGYAILDEGHKIRNPDAEVTLAAKQLQTVHRIIMSGSPIQNRLAELWSLFDYVFPGKLGTLPVFTTQFALPIQIGGYSNASQIQVSTAYKCAVVLRDLIAPYLLRRRKADVSAQLPKKTEQVLFCKLCKEQRDLYRAYLNSQEVDAIFAGNRQALAGIDILRKICNHPDLLERTKWEGSEEYGKPEKSGKLTVLMKVLDHWAQQGHRALLFTQTQQMLDILERCVQGAGHSYHRMDGSTPVGLRARLVDDFNTNEEVFVFLLTTKVGGLGINLTGANRVVVYDPDWNPSTDMQARERAWRIGQRKEVTVYRLITSGTIEEKVYQRQIYKQFLTNKVLSDPRQKRFFKSKDMRDLFTLGDEYANATETSEIFASVNGEVTATLAAEQAPVPELNHAEGYGPESIESDASPDERTPPPKAGPPPLADQTKTSSSSKKRKPAASASADSNTSASDGRASADASANESTAAEPKDEDNAKILRDLFEGTGIMSAIDHSKIESANDPETRAIDYEASRIARQAADALRQSRRECQQAAVNQPTWTGRSGGLGMPAPIRPRFGAAANSRTRSSSTAERSSSAGAGAVGLAGTAGGQALGSAQLLARMHSRQQGMSQASTSAASEPEALAQRITQDLVQYLQRHGGSAPTADIIDHFRLVGQQHAALFRQLLKHIAVLERGGDGSKFWTLKPDFVGDT
ncbi:hypothetical protein ABBQ32_005724 [Trebouxia sp. C0010 RCD-2024]